MKFIAALIAIAAAVKVDNRAHYTYEDIRE